MIEDFVIFKNPHLRYREEEFGGIAKLKLKTIMLNKAQFKIINELGKIKKNSMLNELDKKIVENFLEEGIFLKLDLKEAKKIGFVD